VETATLLQGMLHDGDDDNENLKVQVFVRTFDIFVQLYTDHSRTATTASTPSDSESGPKCEVDKIKAAVNDQHCAYN